MRRQTYKFDRAIIKALVANARTDKPSGRMSATRLTWPTQWQILWKLRVPPSPEAWERKPNKMNTFHFRHFRRGEQCETWLEETLPPMESQIETTYRGWVGYMDRLDKGEHFGVSGDIPHEIKSVKADKWYRMFIQGDGPQYDHVLQACFYAMGHGKPKFGLTYLKSDTLETRTFVYDTSDYSEDVDNFIDEYDKAVTMETVPMFKAKVDYQRNPKYNKYWEYMDMTPSELQGIYQKHNT